MTIELSKCSLVGRAGVFALILLACAALGSADDRSKFCDACLAEEEKDGFRAWVLVTESDDWIEIWNTQSDVRPPLEARDRPYGLGETAYVLTMFSNPAARGELIDVLCDFTVTGPDGSVKETVPEPRIVGPMAASAGSTFISDVHRYFEVEAGDLSGVWRYEVGVTDAVRGVRIPLRVALTADASAEGPAE